MKQTGFYFGVPIEICGKTYYMDMNREGFYEKFSAAHDKVMAEIEKAKDTGDVRPLVDMTREMIDLALGDGSYDSIFAGRVESSYDIGSLYRYIAKIAAEQGKKLKRERTKK